MKLNACIHDLYTQCDHACPDCPEYIRTYRCSGCGERLYEGYDAIYEIDDRFYCSMCNRLIVDAEDSMEDSECYDDEYIF